MLGTLLAQQILPKYSWCLTNALLTFLSIQLPNHFYSNVTILKRCTAYYLPKPPIPISANQWLLCASGLDSWLNKGSLPSSTLPQKWGLSVQHGPSRTWRKNLGQHVCDGFQARHQWPVRDRCSPEARKGPKAGGRWISQGGTPLSVLQVLEPAGEENRGRGFKTEGQHFHPGPGDFLKK